MSSTTPEGGEASGKIEQIGAIYAGFMHEAALRLASIESTLGLIAEAAESECVFLYAEFCYLQLRMTCEVIALAALVAHNELPEANTKALLKNWNADSIFDRLTAVNEHCYPVPLRTVEKSSGEKHLERIGERYLTRDDLKKVYHACGESLHRGVLLHVLEGRRKAYDIQPIREWFAAIRQLLEQHAVLLPDINAALLIRMRGEDGQVHCSRLVGLQGDSFAVVVDDSNETDQ